MVFRSEIQYNEMWTTQLNIQQHLIMKASASAKLRAEIQN